MRPSARGALLATVRATPADPGRRALLSTTTSLLRLPSHAVAAAADRSFAVSCCVFPFFLAPCASCYWFCADRPALADAYGVDDDMGGCLAWLFSAFVPCGHSCVLAQMLNHIRDAPKPGSTVVIMPPSPMGMGLTPIAPMAYAGGQYPAMQQQQQQQQQMMMPQYFPQQQMQMQQTQTQMQMQQPQQQQQYSQYSQEDPPPPPPPPPPGNDVMMPAPSAPKHAGGFCTSCGAGLSGGNFCSSCGAVAPKQL